MILMGIVVISPTLEIGFILIKDLLTPPDLFLGVSELIDIIGMFLVVLIFIELMSGIHAYIRYKVINIGIMLLIAITAVTRKIVILDTKSVDPMAVIGIALLLATLIFGYYVIKGTEHK